MERLWEDGGRPRVADWWNRIKAGDTFAPAFIDWMPQALAEEMRANGETSWPEIATRLSNA